MQTNDKKYIIAGGDDKLYILEAKDGTLKNTLDYSANNKREYWQQIAEVRPNILISVDIYTASVHDIRDIQNIPPSHKLSHLGHHHSILTLESNPGDFAYWWEGCKNL